VKVTPPPAGGLMQAMLVPGLFGCSNYSWFPKVDKRGRSSHLNTALYIFLRNLRTNIQGGV
jgi:hypothetical protein